MSNREDAYDECDAAYEAFRTDTGHITDFSVTKKALYEKAIADYGDKSLTVREGYNPNQYALYCSRFGDLGDFWSLFERLEKEIKNKM